MFAIGISYLNGWAMAAADGARKELAEWPPHPDRVYMALAAAWFETGENPGEGEALRWLETLPHPGISASDCTTRRAVVSFVPVNDSRVSRNVPRSMDLGELRDAGLAVLPEHRSRQPRGFPVAIPYDPNVYLIWPEIELGEHRAALERLTTKVTHVGHSASLVQAWVEVEGEICPTWEPMEGIATHRMRVFSTGRLENLTLAYNRANIVEYEDLKARSDALRGTRRKAMQEEKKRMDSAIAERFGTQAPVRLRPLPTRWQGYGKPVKNDFPDRPASVFDPNLTVLTVRGRRVPLTTTLKLTQALRGVLMDCCPQQPPPEWFSGHKLSGTPTSEPHMALLPLPFVGDQYGDGRVMGLALALPRSLDLEEAGQCLGAFLYDTKTRFPREHRLFDGRWFECRIELETRERLPKNLDVDTWTRASRTWASVTPVVLNRHFKGKDKWAQAAESVKDACGHIGLPRPREVMLHPVSLVEGAPIAREYPQLTRKSDGGRQSHAHAVMIFDVPVRGPVIVGAGRFRGYGLCRPMDN